MQQTRRSPRLIHLPRGRSPRTSYLWQYPSRHSPPPRLWRCSPRQPRPASVRWRTMRSRSSSEIAAARSRRWRSAERPCGMRVAPAPTGRRRCVRRSGRRSSSPDRPRRDCCRLERALRLSTGPARHRVLHLRGCTFWLLGRYDEAVRDLTRAVELSRRAHDKALGGTGARVAWGRPAGPRRHGRLERRLRRGRGRAPRDRRGPRGDALGPQPGARGSPAR